MTILELVIYVCIAGLCGAIGQAIAGYSRGGFLVSIALGFVGAVLGTWLARQMGLPELIPIRVGDATLPVVWSIIGSCLFVAIVGFFSQKGKTTK